MLGRRFLQAACFVLSLVTSTAAVAQLSGATLTGKIADPTGAIVPSATIVVTNGATGAERASKANRDGLYTFSNLQPGLYSVAVTATGFASQVQKGVELTVGGSRELDVSLTIGQASEQIQVNAGLADVETDTSVVSATVGEKRIVELPLNGRDWTQLATLQPGVTNVRSQQSTSLSAGSNRGVRGFGDQLTANGHSPYENSYRLDGINENDYSNGAPGSPVGVNLGVDAIQEFSVVTTAYTAEYGRTSGAVINAVTKSGTNDVHGTAYVFDRDKIFDARNYFDGTNIAPFHRAQFGAAAGGPIRKDKMFLFANYEGIRQSQSIAFLSVVPSATARAGTLHNSSGTATPVTINPNIVPFLQLYPLPNAGLNAGNFGDTGNYQVSAPSHAVENFFTTRFDQTSQKNSFALSYLYDDGSESVPDQLANILSTLSAGRQVGTVTQNHTFGTSVLNVVRLGYNRSLSSLLIPLQAINPAAGDPALGIEPNSFGPTISVSGLTTAYGLGAPRGSTAALNSIQFNDDLAFARGRHSMKVGFAYESLRNTSASIPLNGNVSFSSLTLFLTDQPANVTINPTHTTFPVEPTSNIIGGYFQDDWKTTPRLALNLGLRYEILTIPYDRKNRLGYINTLTAPAGSGPCPSTFTATSTPGCTVPVKKFLQTNPTLHDFEPRVGFSYDVFGSGRTAVRGSFGIYDQLPLPYLYATYAGISRPYSLDAVAVGTAANPLPQGSFPNGLAAIALANSAGRIGHYVDQNPKRDYSLNYSFNIEQQYSPHISSTIGYVGSHSLHAPFNASDINQVAPSNVQVIDGRYIWPLASSGVIAQDANNRNIYGFFFDNSSHYNGLNSQVKLSNFHALTAQATYTWSKCIDYGSGTQSPTTYQNSLSGLIYFDKTMRKGGCDFNITQNFSANGLYELPNPTRSSLLKAVAGGWQVGGIVIASTGVPFTVIEAGGDVLGQQGTSFAPFPNVIAGCNPYSKNFHTRGNAYINVNCFTYPSVPVGSASAALCNQSTTAPANGQVLCLNMEGNERRNSLSGPHQVDADVSLIKNTRVPRLSETANLQLRFEAFNVFNHTNFQAPTNNFTLGARSGFVPTQGTAGLLDSTATTSRQIQLGAKVIF